MDIPIDQYLGLEIRNELKGSDVFLEFVDDAAELDFNRVSFGQYFWFF